MSQSSTEKTAKTARAATGVSVSTESALVSSQGRTTIADTVVSKIAGIATCEVAGVLAVGGNTARAVDALRERIPGGCTNHSQGVGVEVGERQAAVEVELVAEYGVAVADLASGIRRNAIAAVERMTGLEVTEVNVGRCTSPSRTSCERDLTPCGRPGSQHRCRDRRRAPALGGRPPCGGPTAPPRRRRQHRGADAGLRGGRRAARRRRPGPSTWRPGRRPADLVVAAPAAGRRPPGASHLPAQVRRHHLRINGSGTTPTPGTTPLSGTDGGPPDMTTSPIGLLAVVLGAVGYLLGGHRDGDIDLSALVRRRERG